MFVKIATYTDNLTHIRLSKPLCDIMNFRIKDKFSAGIYANKLIIKKDKDSTIVPFESESGKEIVLVVDALFNVSDPITIIYKNFSHDHNIITVYPFNNEIIEQENKLKPNMDVPIPENIPSIDDVIDEIVVDTLEQNVMESIKETLMLETIKISMEYRKNLPIIYYTPDKREVRRDTAEGTIQSLKLLNDDELYQASDLKRRINKLGTNEMSRKANSAGPGGDIQLTPDEIWKLPLEALYPHDPEIGYFVDAAAPDVEYPPITNKKGTRHFSGVRAHNKFKLEPGTMGSIEYDWKGTTVWCNPPYGDNIWTVFCEKGHQQATTINEEGKPFVDYVFMFLGIGVGKVAIKQEESIYYPGSTFEIILQSEVEFFKANLYEQGRTDKDYIGSTKEQHRFIVYSIHPKFKANMIKLVNLLERDGWLYPKKADYYRWMANKLL